YDPLSSSERSERMSRIRDSNTKPEMAVRGIVHNLGFRYALHVSALPGKPDLVFRTRHKVIFVHGCFWRQHKNCRQYRMPRSRLDFWLPKLASNRIRDLAKQKELKKRGWKILIIWECQLKGKAKLAGRIRRFLGS